MKRSMVGLAGLALATIIAAVVIAASAGSGEGQQTDVRGQGDSEPILADDGATLAREPDGLRFRVEVPTPEPGSYEYPTADQRPGWSTAEAHPVVQVGAPEVFTLWVVIFNDPDNCTDDACDGDDFAEGAAARGGIYQGDGRVAHGDELELSGSIRLGQTPSTGAPLDNPIGAEVHLAIASHGKAAAGDDLWMQLNNPLGNPSLWWSAFFSNE